VEKHVYDSRAKSNNSVSYKFETAAPELSASRDPDLEKKDLELWSLRHSKLRTFSPCTLARFPAIPPLYCLLIETIGIVHNALLHATFKCNSELTSHHDCGFPDIRKQSAGREL